MTDLTQDRLRELLTYDPLSGVFAWKVSNSNRALVGQVAGSLNPNGYINIKVDGKLYKAHRLAWLYIHGTFPPNHLDHINGAKSDNRIANLRPATHAENQRNRGKKLNNKSGWCGVHFCKRDGNYRAEIMLNGKHHHLGYYDSPETASAVYSYVVAQVHGEFAKPDIPEWLIADSNTIKAIGGNMRAISKCLAAVAIHNAQKEFA